MDMKNKTCLFCLKQRQILVDNPNTADAIKDIYSIDLPKDGCRICIECHFNILRVQEFKKTIEAAADFDVDSCFVCKSENTVSEPGVDRVVDYLIKQCTTIDFGNTDTIKACVTCMHVLETSIKYEKLARNYASAKRFCKQYSTLRECNVALQKIDLNDLAEICEGFNDGARKRPQPKKGRKRVRTSEGGEDNPSKKSKQEDGSVLPVMLTKLTPTGGKKSSPPNSSKGKSSMKQSDKIFIKLPLFTKPKKKLHQRKKYGAPHSPSRSIPAAPSVEDLNRIFSVELRPLNVQIEKVDLSAYLNKTISHDQENRQLRKPRNEEFIGLDEEDVVEFQNTSMNSSISKRKSILVTERTESPNSAKKKVKFSDSPSIKYVDKLDFSEEENGTKTTDDGDEDYELKKSKKKTPKPPNGTSPATPENGKPRPRGRPKKTSSDENSDDEQEEDVESSKAETTPRPRGRPKKVSKDENSDEEKEDVESSQTEAVPQDDADASKKKDEDTSKSAEKVEAPEGETKSDKEEEEDKDAKETEQSSAGEKKEPTEEKTTEEIKSNEVPVENGDSSEQKTESPVQPPVVDGDQSSPGALDAAPMEAEDADAAEPMKVDQIEDPPADAEMKAIDSPEDVEMAESKSPPLEDVEMKETDSTAAKQTDDGVEAIPNHEPPAEESAEKDDTAPVPEETPNLDKEQQSTGDFETSDKEEEEMEKFKLNISTLLGEEISDSEQDVSQPSHGDETSKSAADKQHDEPETAEDSKSTEEKEENQVESLNPAAQTTPSAESEKKVPDTESPSKKYQSFSSLDDVDDISDDDDILDQLDEPTGVRKRSPDLPPLGEDSL